MNTHLAPRIRIVLLGVAMAVVLTHCASKRTERVKDRQTGMTDYYTDRQELRQTRTEARQERTDAWFDRSMGKPVGSNSNTGLKLP